MAKVTPETQPSNFTIVQITILADDGAKLPSPPFILVEGVPNFRDLGGHKCELLVEDTNDQRPRSIRPRYIFRSAQPTHISDRGLATLTSDLNVHDSYDLRSFKELRLLQKRYEDLSLDLSSVTRHHVPIYKDEDYTPISMADKYKMGGTENFQDKLDALAKRTNDGFIQAYQDILTQAATSGSYRSILLHVLERPKDPLVVHCTVGKDRTGVFAALVLKLCGVSDRAVIWDYALTTQGLGKWREYLIKRILEGAGNDYKNKKPDGSASDEVPKEPPTREQAERIVGSHAEDMKAFLDLVLRDRFGSARQYFRDQCSFSDAELNRIVETLTIESEGIDFLM
jgi:protein tyrosine/serine phosphatase